jgi:hypothetical protein
LNWENQYEIKYKFAQIQPTKYHSNVNIDFSVLANKQNLHKHSFYCLPSPITFGCSVKKNLKFRETGT